MSVRKRYLSLWLPRLAVDRVERPNGPDTVAGAAAGTVAGAVPDAVPDTGVDMSLLPFAVIQAEAGRLLILAANALAATTGVAPGMTLSDGRALCPLLKAVEADLPGDRAALARLQRWCLRYTPWVAQDPATGPAEGGLILDITGCAHLLGGETALLADLAARLDQVGLTHRPAIAGTVGAAWAVGRFAPPESRIVPPGPLHEALADLPMAGLRLPPVDVETLARLGLARIGDLYGIPRAALAARFGDGVRHRLDQALGHAGETISPAAEAPPLRVHRAFPEPLLQPEAVALALDGLLADLCQRLEAAGLGARRLRFRLCRADGSEATAEIGVSRPARDPTHLARLFAPKLETLDPDPGVDLLVLSAPVAEPADPTQIPIAQLPAGGGHHTRKTAAKEIDSALGALIDRLANRLGGDNVCWQGPVATPVPEKQCVALPAVAASRPDWSAWPTGLVAPPRRLAAPEPITPATPADAIDGSDATDATGGAGTPPRRFVWRHRAWRCVQSTATARQPARVLGPWWADDHTARDYHKVEVAPDDRAQTATGKDKEHTPAPPPTRLWLFQDLASGRWHVQGIFS